MVNSNAPGDVVSCVLNGHREGHLIYPTIRSVKRAIEYARSSGLKTEFLAILDRPDTDTRSIVERELKGYGKVHVVDEGDLGLARNIGARRCQGEYIAFVDGDDLWSQTWLVDAFLLCSSRADETVIHPEYNVYFGFDGAHTLQHVDMEDVDFELNHFYRQNYWTALSFAKRSTYLATPYLKNRISEGFGFEDWSWNFETIDKGVVHKVAPGTTHFIRRGKSGGSLLDDTNRLKSVPRVLDVYRRNQPLC
ncbi:MAG: glycosyltransferase family 2 protein [Granulosicoccus sp.]|nr:glycosyltransferase family 2 protein [Granulosicoccus sp.]